MSHFKLTEVFIYGLRLFALLLFKLHLLQYP